MRWETIDLKKMKKKYRFSIVLNWKRYQQLRILMNALKVKQKAKAINFLIDLWTESQELADYLNKEE